LRTEIVVDIAAQPRVVFDLVSDVTRWPELLPHYRYVTVQSRDGGGLTVSMSAHRPIGPLGIPVTWRSRQWSDTSDPNDLRLRFVHVGGATRGMDVTWHIRSTGTGSHVSIEHDFSRRLPLLGDQLYPRIVDRFFVRPIAGRTLATFKALAETRARAD
jgi:ribosome-associated toxin RatA of RatAB toxin-antitoxin module